MTVFDKNHLLKSIRRKLVETLPWLNLNTLTIISIALGRGTNIKTIPMRGIPYGSS
jgi:hypothetical protein